MEKRQESIWCLRGIGALSIILYHYTASYSEYILNVFSYFDFGLFTYAVPMFFILSSMFLYKKVIDFKEPLKLIVYRVTRLLPSYWLAVLYSSFILRVLMQEKFPAILDIVVNFTMLEELFGVESIDGVYWTLYYEVMLLFIFSILSFFMKHIKITSIEKLTDYFCSVWLFWGAILQFAFRFFGG